MLPEYAWLSQGRRDAEEGESARSSEIRSIYWLEGDVAMVRVFIFIFPSLVETARLEFGNLPARRLIRVGPSAPNKPEKQKGWNIYTMAAEKMGHVGPIENSLQKIKKDQ
jgi:hypothetical protein